MEIVVLYILIGSLYLMFWCLFDENIRETMAHCLDLMHPYHLEPLFLFLVVMAWPLMFVSWLYKQFTGKDLNLFE